jgi:hypothetical protein
MSKWLHDGFVFPGNRFAHETMGRGWGRVMDSIARATAEAEADGTGDVSAA